MAAEEAFGRAIRDYFSKKSEELYRDFNINATSVGGRLHNGVPVVTIYSESKLSKKEKEKILEDLTNFFFHFRQMGKIRPLKS